MLSGQTQLTVFTGPMFSAKTERLITAIRQNKYAHKRILVGKPAVDTRTSDFIASRLLNNGVPEIRDRFEATVIGNVDDFRAFVAGDEYDVIAFDEAQFFPLDTPVRDSLGWFGREIRDLLHRRRDTPLHILIAGLDTMSDDMPFGPMPGLLAMADTVEKLKAVCMSCEQSEATKSQNLTGDRPQILVGDSGSYQARCRRCFTPAA